MILPHAYASELPRSEALTAGTADGRPLDVFPSPKGAFISFDMTGPDALVLERPEGWQGAQVKPASYGAEHRVEGTRLFLSLKQARPHLIEGPGNRLVSIVAKPPAEEPPQPGPGGRLYHFDSGKVHDLGALELRDNDVLWLDAGAWVRGQLVASGAKGITIGGRGVLQNPVPAPGEPRYRTILLDHCLDVRISGIHMLTTHGWMITLGGCTGVTVEGISQASHNGGTDGIDVVGSRNVTIRRCFLLNADDCIAVKAMNLKTQASPPQMPGRKFNGDWSAPVGNLLVEDCAFYSDHGGAAMEIGYETRTERITNITFRNIDVMAVHQFGSVFGIHNGDRATVENVLWEDVRVEHHYDKLVDFRVLHSRWNRDPERGRMRGVVLRKIRVIASEYNEGYTVSVIGGWDAGHPVEDVTFEDFQVNGQRILNGDDLCLYTKQAQNIQFR